LTSDVLADSNVLVPFTVVGHLLRPVVRRAVFRLRRQSARLRTTAQNCAEFWNVLTRPVTVRNGHGMPPAQAEVLLRRIERLIPLLPDAPASYAEWRRLVVTYNVSGVQVHDARLVAAMKVHGMTRILTFNTADFARYAPEGITAINPHTV
jgi:predicted nucleic acid-binding protein